MAGVLLDTEPLDWFDAVFAVVRIIPAGRVATYGQVADAVSGIALTARMVGTAMRFAPPDVPWQRVVGAGGRLPIARRSAELGILQRSLLEQEGAAFTGGSSGHVDLERSQWSGGTGQSL